MSLIKCLKKLGFDTHEAAILKQDTQELTVDGKSARDASIEAIQNRIAEYAGEREGMVDQLKEQGVDVTMPIPPVNFKVFDKYGRDTVIPEQDFPVIKYRGKQELIGAPLRTKIEGNGTPEHKELLVNRVLHALYNIANHTTEIVYWYEEAGKFIRELVQGDEARMESIVRITAYLSSHTNIDSNWKQMIIGAYQMETGELDLKHNQFTPEDLRAAVDAKKFDVSNTGIGPKVQRFYENLHDTTFEKNDYPLSATMDTWIGKLLGFPEGSFTANEKGVANQYDYAERVLVEATRRFNDATGVNLLPRQAQAMVWAEIRRPEMSPGASMGFKEVSRRVTQMVTAEALPSIKFEDGKRLDEMSVKDKNSFTVQSMNVFMDENGHDMLMDALNIPLYTRKLSTGGSDGGINPNYVIGLQALKLNGNYDEEHVRTYIRILQYVFRQDAVPYYRADPSLDTSNLDKLYEENKKFDDEHQQFRTHVGFRLTFGNNLTLDHEGNFYKLLQQEMGESIGYTKLPPNQIDIINYEDELDFVDNLDEFIEKHKLELNILPKTKQFGVKGDYGYYEWEGNETGKTLREEIEEYHNGGIGRPDLLERVDNWRAQEQALIESFQTEQEVKIFKSQVASIPTERFMVQFKNAFTFNPFNPREFYIVKPGASENSGAAVELQPWDGNILVNSIRSFVRGEGNASFALNKLAEIADATGATLVLEPVPYKTPTEGRPLTKAQLKKWYKRHGFIQVPDSNEMSRPPTEVSQSMLDWKNESVTYYQNYKDKRFYSDNPGGTWLEHERELAAKSDTFASGSVTAGLRKIDLSPSMVVKLKGELGEHKKIKPGDERVAVIAKSMKQKGYDLNTDSPVFIRVGYDGEAKISEGNHRVRAAIEAGLKTIPVKVSYFAGGETVEGKWNPSSLFKADQPPLDYKKFSMVAYHGTGVEKAFPEFSTNHVGEGEGATYRGWGLYFTEKKDIARWYRNSLSDTYVTYKGKTLEQVATENVELAIQLRNLGSMLGKVTLGETSQEMITEYANKAIELGLVPQIAHLEQAMKNKHMAPDQKYKDKYKARIAEVREAINILAVLDKKDFKKKYTGKLYEVDLTPKEVEYLLWDENMIGQSNAVADAFKSITKDVEKYVRENFSIKKIDGAFFDYEWNSPTRKTNWASFTTMGYAKTYEEAVRQAVTAMVGHEGGGVYEHLAVIHGSEEAASKYLLSKGVKGIKYRAGTATAHYRNKKSPFNYVMFDDSDITIKKFELSARAIQTEIDRAIPVNSIKGFALKPPIPYATPDEQLLNKFNGTELLNEQLVDVQKRDKKMGSFETIVGPYQKIIAAALNDVLDGGLPQLAIDNVSHIVAFNSEVGGEDMAFFVPRNGGRVEHESFLAISSNTLEVLFQSQPLELMKGLRWTLAHELGHALDVGSNPNGDSNASYSDLFAIDPFKVSVIEDHSIKMGGKFVQVANAYGPIMKEAMKGFQSKSAENDGFQRMMMYPLAHMSDIASKGKLVLAQLPWGNTKLKAEHLRDFMRSIELKGRTPNMEGQLLYLQLKDEYVKHIIDTEVLVRMVKAEVFAQYHAMYLVFPELLKKHAPQGYALMKEVITNGNESVGNFEFNRKIRENLQSKVVEQYIDERGAPLWAETRGSTTLGTGQQQTVGGFSSQQLAELRNQQPASFWAVKAPKGSIQFGDDATYINLLKAHDLTTFLHETGHLFLKVMQDLATEPDASQKIKDDFAEIETALGVAPGETITREQHEKWAALFEAYLLEGKAPSAQLRSPFQAYSRWMKQSYPELKKRLGENKLDDTFRDIFDRLLATDSQIKAARSDGYKEVFEHAKAMGVTDAEFEDYQRVAQEVVDAEDTKMDIHAIKEAQQERSEQWEDLEGEMREQVEQDLSQRADVRARYFLTKGELIEGDPLEGVITDPIVFDSGVIAKEYKGTHLPIAMKRKTGGMHPDEVAPIFGFDSGSSLINAIDVIPKYETMVKLEVDKRMSEEHGDIRTDMDRVAQLALDELHNDKRAHLMQLELNAYNKKAGSGKTQVSVMRDAAKRIVGEMHVPEAARVERFLAAERKARKVELQAYADGDFTAARDAKQTQVLNHYLYMNARDAKLKQAKFLRYFKKFTNKTTRKNLKEGDGLQVIDDLMAKYDFRKISMTKVEDRVSLRKWYQSQVNDGLAPNISDEILDDITRTSYKELTMDEFEALYESVKSIETITRGETKVHVAQEIIDFDTAVNEMVASAYDNNKVGKAPPQDPAIESSIKDKFGHLIKGFDATLLKPEMMLAWLDSDQPDGPWHKYLFRPLADAEHARNDLDLLYTNKMLKLFGDMSKSQSDHFLDKVHVPELNMDITHGGLIMMALNTGTESNFYKLVEGSKYLETGGYSQAQVESVLNNREYMSEEDWMFVDNIWKLLRGEGEEKSLFDMANEVEKGLTGTTIKKLKLRKVVTPYGVLDGGYVPIIFSRTESKIKMENPEMVGDTMTGRPSTKSGSMNERIDTFARPLSLDLATIPLHISELTQDITHRRAIRETWKLVTDQRIRRAIQKTLGKEYEAQFSKWIAHVANDKMVDMQGVGIWMKGFRALRLNTSIVAMGFKYTTIIQQPLGITQSIDTMREMEGGELLLAKEVLEVSKHPFQMKDYVFKKSGEMRHRMNNLDRDLRENLRKMIGKSGARANMTRLAFIGMGMTDMLVSLPTWTASYKWALQNRYTEAEAIEWADSRVRLSQGSGSAKDLAAVQRGNEAMKLITMFQSYFNAYYNRIRDTGRFTETIKDVPEFMLRHMYLTLIPALFSEIMSGRGPDEDEDWEKWAAKQVLTYPFLGIPAVRDVASGIESGFGYDWTPAGGGFEHLTRLGSMTPGVIEGDIEMTNYALQAYKVSGYFLGLPTSQTMITFGHLIDAAEGDTDFNPYYLLVREPRK